MKLFIGGIIVVIFIYAVIPISVYLEEKHEKELDEKNKRSRPH